MTGKQSENLSAAEIVIFAECNLMNENKNVKKFQEERIYEQ